MNTAASSLVRASFIAVAVVLLNACATTTTTESLPDISSIDNIDDLVLVDCLLPGQVRQLGARMTYLAARRMVKTTKTDCGIRGGEFVLFDRSNYKQALQTLLPKAQSGDATAQTYVAEIYERGLGLPGPDYAAAATWYRKAAEQGDRAAQTGLGSLYERGLGVGQNSAEALNWYRRASGLDQDRLMFESTFKAQQAAFQREIAVRNRVAQALRTQLKQASTATSSSPATDKSRSRPAPPSKLDPAQLRRQADIQRLDAEGEAERVRKQLHAIEQIKRSDSGMRAQVGKMDSVLTDSGTRAPTDKTEPDLSDSGKRAQVGKMEMTMTEQRRAHLGKMEVTMTEQYRELVETSKQLALVQRF